MTLAVGGSKIREPRTTRRDFVTALAATPLSMSSAPRLWAEDGVFIDPDSRYEGHSGIALAADGVAKQFPNFIFTEFGDIVAYHGIGKLDWGFGPAGAEAIVTGSDVLVMKGDKIGALYAFIDPPKK